MIFRIWHGWTTPANAGAYERIVQEEVFAMIAAKKVDGYRGIDLLRRSVGQEVEFATIMRFDSLEAVKAFAGADHEVSFVPPQGPSRVEAFRRARSALRAHPSYRLHRQRGGSPWLTPSSP